MKEYKNEFESLGSIIKKMAVELEVDRGVKENTLINMWPEIVGPRFKNNSKAVSIIRKGNNDILQVAVSSSAVSQELFLFKKDIMAKLYKITRSFGFKIVDISFNTKIWNAISIETKVNKGKETHIFVKNPTERELKNITLSEETINNIKDSVSGQNFSSLELKDRILNTIIKDIKTQIWRKNNGFPCCLECGIPVDYYTPDKKILCPSCKYSGK